MIGMNILMSTKKYEEGRDFVRLEETKDFIIYEAFNAERIVHLGKYSTWCIAKKKSFFPDTGERKRQGGKTFVIESLTEKNSVEKYKTENEWVQDLVNFSADFDYIIPGDFGKLSTYGLVETEGKERIVVIDFGFTRTVQQAHYSH